MKTLVVGELEASAQVKKAMAQSMPDVIADAASMIISAYRVGKKLLLAGNGGSAADAQHIAAELVGRFKLGRPALRAIALTTNASVLTALANDNAFETVFSRQLEALADEGDIFMAITTSGASPNILKAVEKAHLKKVRVIGLTGENGSELKKLADLTITVPSSDIPRIQEAHITIGHIICYLVEKELFG